MEPGIDRADMSKGSQSVHRYRIDVRLLVVGVLAGVGIFSGRFFYVGGLACVRPFVLVFCLLLPSVAVLSYCMIRLIVRLIRQWSLLGRRGRLLRVAVVFAVPILIVIGSQGRVTDRPFLQGFAHRVENRANLAALQSWLTELENLGYKHGDNLPEDDWPTEVRSLSPVFVRVIGPPFEKNTQLQLVWGGGFGHWGLLVGPTTMETPVPGEGGLEEHMEIVPGVYAWEEL